MNCKISEQIFEATLRCLQNELYYMIASLAYYAYMALKFFCLQRASLCLNLIILSFLSSMIEAQSKCFPMRSIMGLLLYHIKLAKP